MLNSLQKPINITKCMILFMLLGLVGCGKKEPEKIGQTVVRVNGDEITIHQINQELMSAKIATKDDNALKSVTTGLVQRQLLVQAALNAKLDRNANVQQEIERSKSVILAQAYLQQKMSIATKPAENEISQYRYAHPEYFENRKIYAMENIVIDPVIGDAGFETLESKVKTHEDLLAELAKMNLKYIKRGSAIPSEKLNQSLNNRLSSMMPGQIVFIKADQQFIVSKLIAVKPAPVPESQIKSVITNILMAEKQQKLAKSEVDALTKAAKIEYINTKYQNNTAAKPTTGSSTANKTKDNKSKESHTEKGISGL